MDKTISKEVEQIPPSATLKATQFIQCTHTLGNSSYFSQYQKMCVCMAWMGSACLLEILIHWHYTCNMLHWYNNVMSPCSYFITVSQLSNLFFRFKAFCRAALHSIDDSAETVSPVNGTFKHERATAHILTTSSPSYSTISAVCTSARTSFKGLNLTLLHTRDLGASEGEVRFKLCVCALRTVIDIIRSSPYDIYGTVLYLCF